MMRRVTVFSTVVLVLAAAALPAAAQDKDTWDDAVRAYKGCLQSSVTNPNKIAQAVRGIGNATFPDVDADSAKYAVQAMKLEFHEGRGGAREEMVNEVVLEAAAFVFSRITKESVIKDLVKQAVKNENARLGYYIIKGLNSGGSSTFKAELNNLVNDDDPLIQMAAVDALVESGDSSHLDTFIKVIEDIGRAWEVKDSALKGVGRHLSATDWDRIGRLVDALGKTPDSQYRFRCNLRDFLNRLLGTNVQTHDGNAWRAALNELRQGGGGGGGGGGGAPLGGAGGGGGAPSAGHKTVATGEFFGIKTESTRIVFVLDRTGSMNDPCTAPPVKGGEDEEEEREGVATGKKAKSQGDVKKKKKARDIKKKYDDRQINTKLDALKREYINAVYNLDERVYFSTVWYHNAMAKWKEKLVPATWDNKLSAIAFADGLQGIGSTNIFGGIEAAFQMVAAAGPRKRGGSGRKPVATGKRGGYSAPGADMADTIYVLTDGKHNTGKFVVGGGQGSMPSCDKAGFLAEIRKINKTRKVIIHTICLGDIGVGSDPPDPGFLRQLAEENGGKFRHVTGR
ncbi:MAG: hypothetical protein ACYTAF_01215 [Planctomycetota bacterium]|jgi:hypothetical protein